MLALCCTVCCCWCFYLHLYHLRCLKLGWFWLVVSALLMNIIMIVCVFFLLLFLILFTALPCLSETSSYAIRSAFAHSIQLHAYVFELDEKTKATQTSFVLMVSQAISNKTKRNIREKWKLLRKLDCLHEGQRLFSVCSLLLFVSPHLSPTLSPTKPMWDRCAKKMSAESELCRNVIAQKICGIGGEWEMYHNHNLNQHQIENLQKMAFAVKASPIFILILFIFTQISCFPN